MTPAQKYATSYADSIFKRNTPIKREDLEIYLELAFMAGIDHATAKSFAMANDAISNLAKSWMPQPPIGANEVFQASKPTIFDRSVLDKLPRFDCYSAQSEFYADEEKDGKWVKFEDVVRLTEEPK